MQLSYCCTHTIVSASLGIMFCSAKIYLLYGGILTVLLFFSIHRAISNMFRLIQSLIIDPIDYVIGIHQSYLHGL